MADQTPPPGLTLIADFAAPEETTDPQLFARPEEPTVRRCQCGRELEPCDRCDLKFRAGCALVLNTAYKALCRKMSAQEAREVVDALATEAGVELVL